MSRIPLSAPEEATGTRKQLFDAVRKKLGLVPNMMKALGTAPAVLKGYLDLGGAVAASSLSPTLREEIALHVGEINACGYCLSAHAAIGGQLGLDAARIESARRGRADGDKETAALALARAIVVERGHVRDEDLRSARAAGLSDAEIVEVFGATLLNVFTNWFNHVADTPIDFPVVEPGLELEQAR